jgi:hypothetical protein
MEMEKKNNKKDKVSMKKRDKNMIMKESSLKTKYDLNSSDEDEYEEEFEYSDSDNESEEDIDEKIPEKKREKIKEKEKSLNNLISRTKLKLKNEKKVDKKESKKLKDILKSKKKDKNKVKESKKSVDFLKTKKKEKEKEKAEGKGKGKGKEKDKDKVKEKEKSKEKEKDIIVDSNVIQENNGKIEEEQKEANSLKEEQIMKLPLIERIAIRNKNVQIDTLKSLVVKPVQTIKETKPTPEKKKPTKKEKEVLVVSGSKEFLKNKRKVPEEIVREVNVREKRSERKAKPKDFYLESFESDEN